MSLNNNKRRRTRTATLDATIQKAETRKVKGDDSGQKSVKQLKNKNEVFKMSSGKASISMSCTCHSYSCKKGLVDEGSNKKKTKKAFLIKTKDAKLKHISTNTS